MGQKYWDGTQWVGWEDRTGLSGPFVGTPIASSWGQYRADLWAVGESSHLYHNFWDVSYWTDWEDMGGIFKTAPQVIHQARIASTFWVNWAQTTRSTITSFGMALNGSLRFTEWFPKGGDFASAPASC